MVLRSTKNPSKSKCCTTQNDPLLHVIQRPELLIILVVLLLVYQTRTNSMLDYFQPKTIISNLVFWALVIRHELFHRIHYIRFCNLYQSENGLHKNSISFHFAYGLCNNVRMLCKSECRNENKWLRTHILCQPFVRDALIHTNVLQRLCTPSARACALHFISLIPKSASLRIGVHLLSAVCLYDVRLSLHFDFVRFLLSALHRSCCCCSFYFNDARHLRSLTVKTATAFQVILCIVISTGASYKF